MTHAERTWLPAKPKAPVIPFADSDKLASKSGAKLIEVGSDHRLADPEPLAAMLKAAMGSGESE